MRRVDRLIQRWRIHHALHWINPTDRVLDIGCADGALFHVARGRFRDGVGVDPDRRNTVRIDSALLVKGTFPDDLPDDRPFDVITMLAVLEHISPTAQASLAVACASHLRAGGHLVITVPSPRVDAVLALLRVMRLADGMSVEQHYGFDPNTTASLFEPHGFRVVERRRFQLGLNNLFVFQKAL
jgi:2-polyprenyl-3-methyl-5-hydroxy-6-metoxy-1,4-benzoquinol methylase